MTRAAPRALALLKGQVTLSRLAPSGLQLCARRILSGRRSPRRPRHVASGPRCVGGDGKAPLGTVGAAVPRGEHDIPGPGTRPAPPRSEEMRPGTSRHVGSCRTRRATPLTKKQLHGTRSDEIIRSLDAQTSPKPLSKGGERGAAQTLRLLSGAPPVGLRAGGVRVCKETVLGLAPRRLSTFPLTFRLLNAFLRWNFIPLP